MRAARQSTISSDQIAKFVEKVLADRTAGALLARAQMSSENSPSPRTTPSAVLISEQNVFSRAITAPVTTSVFGEGITTRGRATLTARRDAHATELRQTPRGSCSGFVQMFSRTQPQLPSEPVSAFDAGENMPSSTEEEEETPTRVQLATGSGEESEVRGKCKNLAAGVFMGAYKCFKRVLIGTQPQLPSEPVSAFDAGEDMASSAEEVQETPTRVQLAALPSEERQGLCEITSDDLTVFQVSGNISQGKMLRARSSPPARSSSPGDAGRAPFPSMALVQLS
jgi:hypothetical protein